MDISRILAENLKRLRLERNLSLGQLAELCQVSKVMLSQIEKAETNPTVNTIWKIAGGLKVSYTTLLSEHSPEATLVRKEDARLQRSENGVCFYGYYDTTATRNFEQFIMEIAPLSSYQSVGHQTHSEEYLTILEGELLLTANGESYQLKEADSICFVADVSHTYTNPTNKLLRAVMIIYYPA